MIPTKRKVIVHGNERWQLDFGLDPVTGALQFRREFYVSFV